MKKNFVLPALAALAAVTLVFTGCKDPEPVKVSSITVTPASHTLEIGGTVTLSAVVAPADADNAAYIWSSSADAVATVSASGVVTAVSAGTATITATASDGSEVKGTASITVNPAPAEPAATITPGAGFAATGKTTVNYSEALDAEGNPAIDLSIGLGVVYNFGAINLKLTTDNVMINGVLAQNELTDGFNLLALTPAQQAALGALMPGLVPAEAPGKNLTLNFSSILPMVVGMVPGGISQFDIEVEVTDAVGDVTPAPQNATATLEKTFEMEFVDNISVSLTATDNLDMSEVNAITYTYIANGEGEGPVPAAITVASEAGIASLKLTLTTDNAFLNGTLTAMGLTETFDLTGELTPQQANGLAMIGFPSGAAVVEQTSVTLPLNQLYGVIASMIPGGINQFDIKIEAADANGAKLVPERTLKLKFVDDTILEITGDGIGDDRLEVKASEAGTKQVKVDIASGAGIDKLEVTIVSSSAAFTGGLATIGLDQKFDIANPDEALTATLAGIADMGIPLPYGDDVKGQNALEFDITGFMPFIFQVRGAGEETGNCTADFTLTVTDANGQTLTKTIKLDLVDDSAPAGTE